MSSKLQCMKMENFIILCSVIERSLEFRIACHSLTPFFVHGSKLRKKSSKSIPAFGEKPSFSQQYLCQNSTF